MWNRVLLNVHVATMADRKPDYGRIENAAIGIEDGHIVWVGRQEDLPDAPENLAEEIIDGEECWVTPGLIDCHTHIVYGGNRAREFEQRLQGRSYVEIAEEGGGILSTVRATRAASEEELYDLAEDRLLHLMADGVTTVEIKSGYGLDFETERKMLRVIRQLGEAHPVTIKATYLGAHTIPPEYTDASAGGPDDYVTQICEKYLPSLYEEGLVDAVDVFCESIAFSPTQTEKIFQAARALSLPVKLHADQLSNREGAGLAATYGALSADHIEYSSEKSIRQMAEAGTVAVLLPGAFYALKETQLPDMKALRTYDVPMALATDCNPGSSPVLSLRLMMNMGCTYFGMTPEEALAAVTCNAAKALGMGATHGTIEEGKVANLTLWDIADLAELSYYIGGNLCAGVCFEGEFI